MVALTNHVIRGMQSHNYPVTWETCTLQQRYEIIFGDVAVFMNVFMAGLY